MPSSRLILGTALVAIWSFAVSDADAQSVNAGALAASTTRPFQSQTVAEFDTPWALAFLPDGRMLVTEKPGALYLVTDSGEKTEVSGVPAVAAPGQNGLLDVAIAPDFAESNYVYLTYVEPDPDGARLALARAKLVEDGDEARLEDFSAIWRQTPGGGRGQPGGIIAIEPQGAHLFLTVGDRMDPESAQDPDMARGKVLRLGLDGSTPADNPMVAEGGVKAQTWTTGHRNPYGLAFDAKGQLWLHEMGPRGGDELNLIEPGQNYGWPVVSNGNNYSGSDIPDHETRPEFAPPAVYWTPVIAPAGLAFYEADLFPAWKGSGLIGGLAVQALVRVGFGSGPADEADRWDMGARIRDVAVASDGAVWVLEDASPGKLRRLTPRE
ncbi:PQQ-dependent sugar dehydrogenase [Cypionkella sp.]|uniref:PQQ-dependent sugar dehydrogenase n=1 Tax=Cypionkella sp. TaxID=2811411 RepID=UPI0026154193|nr:PQQ-dependent sugar dehydrogenase [Cypionkella sp.]MDB5665719.1 putative Glucose sorbosone dehydrogenase [Cypionkella sp.]